MMVRELGFEMKAQPSEKLKNPEEIAREERERLQKLEVTCAHTQNPEHTPSSDRHGSHNEHTQLYICPQNGTS